jgi:hypothetical protein
MSVVPRAKHQRCLPREGLGQELGSRLLYSTCVSSLTVEELLTKNCVSKCIGLRKNYYAGGQCDLQRLPLPKCVHLRPPLISKLPEWRF